jgi:hypothetical protein
MIVSDTENSDSSSNATGDQFLERWSQRKAAARKDETDIEASPAAVADALPAESDPQPELTDADMPPIESLDKDSDYSVFMSPGVSEQLRTIALRKLFHLPAFNITDGLNDYDEDYTQFAGLGGVVTHEMKRMLKRELEAKAAAAEEVVPVVEGEASLPSEDVVDNHADMDDDAEESV